jgi:hypothetical protein
VGSAGFALAARGLGRDCDINSLLCYGGTVEARVSLAGDRRIDELESLDDWLGGEPRLAGRVKMSGVGVPRAQRGVVPR